MSNSAAQKIAEIQRKADEEIAALRQEAAREVAARWVALKQEIQSLEEHYVRLVGKPLPIESSSGAKPIGTRGRLSLENKAALVETLRGILAANPTGVSMGQLTRETGASAPVVRQALIQIKTKTTGQKAGTRYFFR